MMNGVFGHYVQWSLSWLDVDRSLFRSRTCNVANVYCHMINRPTVLYESRDDHERVHF